MRAARALLLFLFLCASWHAHASEPIPVAPAVLARIQAAHRIFVSNAGEDDTLSTNAAEGIGYILLYQQLIGWPGIQLVDSPAQADLVFQVYCDSSQGLFDRSPTLYLHLSVLDPVTQQILWTNTSDLYSAKDALKPIAPAKTHPGKEFARLPAQMKNPKKLFIQLPPQPQPSTHAQAAAAFSQAILQSGNYISVDSPEQADLILLPSIVDSNLNKNGFPLLGTIRVEILDPGTKTVLWTFENRYVYTRKITPEQQIPVTMPYIVKSWNGFIGKVSYSCLTQLVDATCSMK